MPSISTPVFEPLCVLLSDFGLGSPWERHLDRFRVWSRNVTRGKASPVLWIPWSSEVRAHAQLWVWCRLNDIDRVWCTVTFMVRVTVRFRCRSHETPDTDPKQQVSTWRAECSTQGRVPVSLRIWVPRPNKCMGHRLGRPQDSRCAAAVVLWKWHGEVPSSMSTISGPILEPVCELLSDIGIGSQWVQSLS